MKTTMKQLAAGTFIALLFLVGNVKAEATEIKSTTIESIETTLQLENWMTNETIWNNNSFSFYEFAQETETSMILENWMTSEKTWELNTNFVEESEAGLELEGWMTSKKTWKTRNKNFEPKLKIENWMINSDIWK